MALLTLAACAFIAVGLPLLAAWPRGRARWQDLWMRLWSGGVLRILGVRVTVVGHPPARPCCMVANHLSYLDIPLLAAHAPCVYVAKGEIAGWPVAGAVCRLVNTAFIDRKLKRDIPRSLAAIERLLARGQRVAIFAEATSSSGAAVLPFRSPLLELPLRLGLPVHPVTLSYATPGDDPPACLAVCWWGEMPLAPHLDTLLVLDRIEARLVFGAEPVMGEDRKAVAARLQEAVAAAFTPLPQSTEIRTSAPEP